MKAVCWMGTNKVETLTVADPKLVNPHDAIIKITRLNGLLAPPLMVMVVLLTSDKEMMGNRMNTRGMKWLGWSCAVIMSAVAATLIVSLV